MSIGKRFINMARSELNSLLEKASRVGEDDDDQPARERDDLAAFSEAELEAELERRKLEREIEARARKANSQARPRAGATTVGAGASTRSTSAGRAGSTGRRTAPAVPRAGDAVKRAYAALELAPGADMITVKSAYRRLMRKYHPDRHAGSKDKEKAAHELAQKLTAAYETLEKHLR